MCVLFGMTLIYRAKSSEMGTNQMRRNGEDQEQAIRPDFNRSIMTDFKGAKITSDVGFLLLREIDERFGILGPIGKDLEDSRAPTHQAVSASNGSSEGASPLTEGSRVGYVQILKKGSLIWHKCGNWNRWTIFRRAAAPIRGSKSIAELVLGQNDRHL